MKAHLALAALLLAAAFAHGQNCDSIINDEAGVLRDTDAITKGVHPLIDEGADVKIVTVPSIAKYGSNLQAVETAYESRCPSWKAPTGVRKANLFVLMLAPTERKKNAFFGSAYSPVLPSEDTVNTIYSHAANPYFANKQWEQGFGAAAKDFAAKVVAYHDQQQHPAPAASTTINQQPTDLSGLWWFMKWLLIFAGIAAAIFGITVFFKGRQKRQDEAASEQSQALDEWNRANQAYLDMDKSNDAYGRISRQFADMSNSIKYNPNETMTAPEYRAAGRAWRDLRNSVVLASQPRRTTPPPIGWRRRGVAHAVAALDPDPKASGAKEASGRPHHHQKQAPAAQPTPERVIERETVVRDSGDGVLTGVLLDEALHSRREEPRYEPDPPRYREPDPEPEPTRSGSDSSWGSSSDDSSSFGGGGDSSFGGGGDSGGSGSDSSF